MSTAAIGAAAAAAAAIAQATKASGVIVRVDKAGFLAILGRQPEPLVVTATGGIFYSVYSYLTSYKGLAFYAELEEPLELPPAAEVVKANGIWVPG